MPDTTTNQLDEAGWLDLDRTATLEGISRQAVSRKLTKGTYAATRKAPCRNGEKWQVHVSCLQLDAQMAYRKEQSDVLLASHIDGLVQAQMALPTPAPSGSQASYMAAPAPKRRDADRRKRLLEEWLALGSTTERTVFAKAHKVTMQTLYNWKKRFDGASPSLLNRSGRTKGTTNFPPEVAAFCERLYFQPERPMKIQVHHALRAEFGPQAPPYSTLARWIATAIEDNPAYATYARQGSKAYRDRHEAYVQRLAPEHCNEIWVGDHHQIDVLVVAPDDTIQRPWLTGWMDWCSRALVGYDLNFGPNSMSIARAMRDGIIKKEGLPWCGRPDHVLMDNGRDYRSKHLNGETHLVYHQSEETIGAGFFGEIGTKVHFCQPYHGQSKVIERGFRTVYSFVLNLLPGYIGNKPSNRPETASIQVAQTQKWIKAGKPEDERPPLLMWYEFSAIFELAMEHYHNHKHRGLKGLTPSQAWMRNARPAVMPHETLLDLLCFPKVNRIIQKGGRITVHGNAYDHDNMLGLECPVEVFYNPNDPATVTVIRKGQFLCKAALVESLPAMAETEEEKALVAEVIRKRKAVEKAFKERLRQSRFSLYLPPITRCDTNGQEQPVIQQTGRLSRAARKAAEAPALPPTAAQAAAVSGQVLRLWGFQPEPESKETRP